MPDIRKFAYSDVPRVADLVWKVLHEQQGSAPAALRDYLTDLFLRNPWFDETISSLVYEDSNGKVVGFFGIVPRHMSVQGKALRFAFGSNFVMDPDSRASMGAMQLVRAFMKGPQDVTITDSANESARQLLRSMGLAVVPVYSLLWARPLRPSKYFLHGASRLKKNKTIKTIGTIASPFSSVADYLVTTSKLSPFRQKAPTTTAETLDNETLLQCLAAIPNKQWILPQYTRESLDWLLRFLDNRRAMGDLRKVLLRDENKKIVGWYIYGLGHGVLGEVLQIGVDAASAGKVLDHLFYDAWERGLIGLHGRMEPQLMEELTQRACVFLRSGSWTLAYSNKPELLNGLANGMAFFSRLDGEWSLRYGGNQAHAAD